MTISATVRNEFDPEPDAAYGDCLDCGLILLDEAAASQHMKDTSTPTDTSNNTTTSSHRVSIANPTREERIDWKVTSIVDDAIMETTNRLLRLVGPNKASTEEITHALRFYSDFIEGWQKELEEYYENPIQQPLFDYLDPNKKTSDD